MIAQVPAHPPAPAPTLLVRPVPLPLLAESKLELEQGARGELVGRSSRQEGQLRVAQERGAELAAALSQVRAHGPASRQLGDDPAELGLGQTGRLS
jgi:hypothetical protein